MKYTLSFGYINQVSAHIAELIIDNSTIITVEMFEEYNEFITKHFSKPYAVLVNSINTYSMSPEVTLLAARSRDLAATATVSFGNESEQVVEKFLKDRGPENLNFRKFSGFEMGRIKAIRWLELELIKAKENA
ncbi:hypothetical protein RI845_17335 [Thalassotalea nanhaiensis]|uniref:STAS/SEC14 domain-containing protein n=1 Tax=Thalassotalea nanhaiensis TaxID=3065648 RepID=A0ABY9THK0_9GAMM|nr:hypothetical protein RI845_17335 [Colwelliaceae bacterium SQ345]